MELRWEQESGRLSIPSATKNGRQRQGRNGNAARQIASEKAGRRLTRGEVAHHHNCLPWDDSDKNISHYPRDLHRVQHWLLNSDAVDDDRKWLAMTRAPQAVELALGMLEAGANIGHTVVEVRDATQLAGGTTACLVRLADRNKHREYPLAETMVAFLSC
ncbi:MAG: hypothetical protein ACYTEQ_28750 [Planctomycetota bacterium]|jgi:hypothetical protein